MCELIYYVRYVQTPFPNPVPEHRKGGACNGRKGLSAGTTSTPTSAVLRVEPGMSLANWEPAARDGKSRRRDVGMKISWKNWKVKSSWGKVWKGSRL